MKKNCPSVQGNEEMPEKQEVKKGTAKGQKKTKGTTELSIPWKTPPEIKRKIVSADGIIIGAVLNFENKTEIKIYFEQCLPALSFWKIFVPFLEEYPKQEQILAFIKEMKEAEVPEVLEEGVGWKDGKFQTDSGIFSPTGFQAFNPGRYFLQPREEEPELLFSFLKEFPAPEISYPLAGWFAASYLKNEIPGLGFYPYFFLSGEQGSGKTTLALLFLRFFGLRPEELAADDTEFASIEIIKKPFPLFFDEFSVNKQRCQAFLSLLAQGYYSGKKRRGRSNLAVSEFPLRAPIIVAGETPPLSGRIKERIILVFLKKKPLSKFSERIANYESLELQNFFFAYMKFLTEKKSSLEFKRIFPERLQGIRKWKGLPVRIKLNLLLVDFGLSLLGKFAKEKKIEWVVKKDLYHFIFDSLIANLIEELPSDLEDFLNDLDEMREGGILEDEYFEQDEEFYLNLHSAYRKWKSWTSRHHLRNERANLSEVLIRQMLKELSSFVKFTRAISPRGRRRKRFLVFSEDILST